MFSPVSRGAWFNSSRFEQRAELTRRRMITIYGKPNTAYEIRYTNNMVCEGSVPNPCVVDSSLWPVGWTNVVPGSLFYSEPLPTVFSNAPILFLHANER